MNTKTQNKKRQNTEPKAKIGPITSRVTSWKDVCRELGIDPVTSLPFRNPKNKAERSLNGAFKIMKWSEVLNEGVVLDFLNISQDKFYCWWQKTNAGWVLRSVNFYSYCALVGSGFYFATRELANHAAIYAKDAYLDYLPE